MIETLKEFLEKDTLWCKCITYEDTPNEETKIVEFSKALLALEMQKKETAQKIFDEIEKYSAFTINEHGVASFLIGKPVFEAMKVHWLGEKK